MMRSGTGLKVQFLFLVLLTGLAACANNQTFPPPSFEVRQQLASASVVPVRYQQTVVLGEPNSGIGRGALKGAAAGASALELCSGGMIACMIGLPIAVVATPVGAAIGAGAAHTEQEAAVASASLRGALASATLTEDLFAHLRVAGSRLGTGNPLLVEGSAADRVVDEHDPGRAWPGSILEIGAVNTGIASRGDLDPDLLIILSAHARLVRASDRAGIYERTWTYSSPWRDYYDMAGDDASLLRAMIDTGLNALAAAVLNDLFLETEPEIHAVGPVPAGEVWTTMVWPQLR